MLQNRNRVIALKLSVECRGGGENVEGIIRRAQAFEEYLEGPEVAAEPSPPPSKGKKTASKG